MGHEWDIQPQYKSHSFGGPLRASLASQNLSPSIWETALVSEKLLWRGAGAPEQSQGWCVPVCHWRRAVGSLRQVCSRQENPSPVTSGSTPLFLLQHRQHLLKT